MNESKMVRMRQEREGLYDLPYETVWLDEEQYSSVSDVIKEYCQEERGLTVTGESGRILRVDVCSDTMLRLRIVPGKIEESVTERYGLISQPVHEAKWQDSFEQEEIKVQTESLVFCYSFRNHEFAVKKVDGTVLLKTTDGGVRFSQEPADFGGDRTFTRFQRIAEEHYFGFGGRTMPPDRTGTTADMLAVKVGVPQGDFGGFPVPYFISTGGYGFFLNNPWPHVYFDMACSRDDQWFVHTPGGQFDLFVFVGNNFEEITRQYTEITGRIPCCDKAVLGFWCSSIRFEEDREILEGVKRLHSEGYPCDAVVLDGPWRGGKAFLRDYSKNSDYATNDINWHPDFGDGPNMIRKLLEKNVKTSLHINSRSFLPETYIPAVEKGLLRKVGQEVVPDFRTQEAIDYYKSLLRPRIEEGLWVWWTDHGDRVSGEIDEGVPSRNLFGALWNKVIAETMEEMGHPNSVSLSRGSGIGGQKYALPWPGDTKFGIDRFREDIWFCLNVGLAGYAVSSYDLGGFTNVKLDPYDVEKDLAFDQENICRRMLQSILFVPNPRIHNGQYSIPKFPWNCPEETRELYKEVLKYRYEMTPYFYSAMIEASHNGTPIMRPLVYHHMEDPITYCINDEFYLGSDILVAPVVNYGERYRLVYLPEGTWVDQWTGKEYEGSRFVSMECPLYELRGLPMLIRKGAIIPRQEFSLTLQEDVPYKLYLDVYPSETGQLFLWEGKNLKNRFSYCKTEGALEVTLENNSDVERTYVVRGIGYEEAAICVPSHTTGQMVICKD